MFERALLGKPFNPDEPNMQESFVHCGVFWGSFGIGGDCKQISPLVVKRFEKLGDI